MEKRTNLRIYFENARVCIRFLRNKNVIQTTEGRKNLEYIHVYVSEILRFALNDNLLYMPFLLKSHDVLRDLLHKWH